MQDFGLDDKVSYICGDSNVTLDNINEEFDFIMSCPPYADLEVYSDDSADLSNMDYENFIKVYTSIIHKVCSKLKDDRFACFVVSEVRGKDGIFYNFVSDTIEAFRKAGMKYYNEIILLNTAGTLPLRAGKTFNVSRKVGRSHQNILVFYKGDTTKIRENFKKLNEKTIDNIE